MNGIKQPTKERVRQYLQKRQAEHVAPPPQDEIRRRLGWGLNGKAGHDRVEWVLS